MLKQWPIYSSADGPDAAPPLTADEWTTLWLVVSVSISSEISKKMLVMRMQMESEIFFANFRQVALRFAFSAPVHAAAPVLI